MKKLQFNIQKLYIIRGLSNFMLIIPVIVPFFQENGLSVREIIMLQSLFAWAVIAMEIPTGYFSDTFSRKSAIVIGGIFATAGVVVYTQSHTFWNFLLAEIILGFGVSFISGADSSMLYETLLAEGREGEYKKLGGRNSSIGLFSESVACVLGGFLALVSLRLPLYCDMLIVCWVIPVALTLVEPKKDCSRKTESSLKKMLSFVKFALHDHAEVKWLILYSATISASTLTMFWLSQPYFLATGVSLEFFGITMAIFLLCSALFSWNAHWVENFLGKKNSLIFLIILTTLGYVSLSSFWVMWSGAFILLFYAARGINNPVVLDYINGLISSDMRATVLSVKNLVSRAIFALIGPVIGWVSDAYSVKAALLFSGTTFLILGSIALLFLKKHKAL
ncbi:MAG: MFS transporter [Parcubacteria group bacterium]